MKKFLLFFLVSCIPFYLVAQPLAVDIQISSIPYSSYDLCVGDDVILTGVGSGGTLPYSYTWAGGGGQLSPLAGQSPTFTATSAGTYVLTCTVTDGASGTATDNITINVNPLPNLFAFPGNPIICLGDCINLSASTTTGDGVIWYEGFIGGTVLASGGTNLIVNVCPTVTTDYYAMSYVSSTGCVKSKKVTVTVINLTATAIADQNPICMGDTSCLTATPAGGLGPYTYQWSPNTTISDINIANPCVWPITNTTYIVTITDQTSGCSATASVLITVNPQQPPTINSDTTICYGGCATLVATGSGNIWQWAVPPGGTNATVVVCPTATTIYTVTMTDAAGCTASDDAVVIVNPQLTAMAGPDQFVCYGNCITIGQAPNSVAGGSAPYSYAWSSVPASVIPAIATPNVCPTVTTTYTLTVTDAAGCTAIDAAIVTVNPQIIVSIAPTPPSLCLGGCSNLITTVSGGTPGYTYQWSPCGSLDNCTIQNPLACPNITTVYNVTVTDAAGCTQTATTTVTINVPPTATAANDQTICSGICVSIGGTPSTASAGTPPYTYAWSSVPASVIPAIANPSVCPTVTTTYTVLVTDAAGCTASDAVTINVNPSPIANAGTDVTFCQGQCVAIGGSPTATGGTPGYTYQWSPAGSLNNATIANPTACPLTTTTYCVTVTDALGCTASDCVTITVNTVTATAVANPATICAGACSDITATGGGTYLWCCGLGTNATVNVCPVVTTTYTVTVTAPNGCTAAASATVTVNVLNVTATPDVNPICPPACTNITANPTGGSGTYTYQWNTAGLTQVINVCPAATTTYTVTVTDAVTGCTQSASATINVYTATASATPANICSGGCSLLTATSIPAGGTFQWCCGLGNTPTVSVCPTVTTTYTVTVTNGGCTSTASVTVNVTTVTATATPTTSPLCIGQCTNITATGSGGTAPYTYLWGGGQTTAVINVCPITTTTYPVTITDANGCSGTASATVNVITVTVTGNPTSICPGGTAMLIATGGPTYNWCCGLGTNDTVYVTPAVTTTYTVTVTVGGCTASAAYTVTVNALTVTASANPTTICSGGTTPVTLSTAGGGTYLWSSVPADPSLAGQTALQNPVVTPNATTTYSVIVTNGGCSASASVTVTVDNVNATAIASPNTVCAGSCTTISVNITGGTGPYTYQWCCGLGNGPTATVCPVSNTTYDVTITDNNGCSDVASITINVLSLPIAAINPASTNICTGGTVTLTASGGVTYNWCNGLGINPVIVVSPVTTTAYCVMVTGANGCTALANATVNVTAAPTASINVTPSTTICSGECVTMTASGGSNYQWSNPPGLATATINVCPAVTTTYTVTVTQAGCTTQAVASVTITVNPMPTATLTSDDADQIVCSGTVVTFTDIGSGAALYTFNVNGSNVIASGNNTYSQALTINPTTVYVIASNGTCVDTSNVLTFTVNPKPDITITTVNLPSICGACDGSIITSTTGGVAPYTYQWNTTPVQNTPNATSLCAGSYAVTVTDLNGCSDASSAAVSDPGSISVTLTSTGNTVCTGSCVTFTATPVPATAVNYTFSINGGVPPAYSGPLNTYTTCTLANGDIVQAGATDALGCTGFSNQIVMVVNPLPTVFTLTGGGQFCQGGVGVPIGVNGSEAGVQYILYLGVSSIGAPVIGTGFPISFGNQTTTGTYTVMAQNTTSTCATWMLGSVTVTQNPLPTQFSVTGGGTFCGGGAGVPVCLNGSDPGIMYQLLINSIPDTTIVGTGAAICFGNQNVTGTYCVTATNTLTTCSVAMLNCVNVTASPIPTAYTVTGGGNYCTGGIGVLVGISGSDPGVNYQVIGPSGPTLPMYPGTGSVLDFNYFTAPGVYTVTGTNGSCSNTMTGSVTIAVNPSPIANAGNDTTICQWSSATLNGSGAGVGGSYLWAPSTWLNPDSIANPVITPQATITYFLTVTDVNGCTASDNVVITVNPFTLPVIAATDTGFCTGDPVLSTLSVIPGPPAYASYVWSPPGGSGPTLNVNAVGCYIVTVTAANGCSAASPAQCIQMYPPMPPADILSNGDTHFCQPDSVMLYMNNPYYTFEWSSGSINVPSIYVAETGYYSVTVTDSFGCVYYAGPDTVIVDPLPHAIISYVDTQDTLTFDFYSYSLYGNIYLWNFGDGSPNSNNEDVVHEYLTPGTYTVTLTVSNNCGTDVATAIINVHQSPDGIGESSGISNLVLYPNPARDLVNIDFTLINSKQITITMFDALSQQMYNESLEFGIGKHHKEINISTLPRGIYFFKIASDDGIYIEKLVKN